MPYTVSASRKQLEERLIEITKRLRRADKNGVPPELREYAIAAAIFLSHAEVENFFGDILARIAMAYSNGVAHSSGLPSRLRAHLVVEKLNLQSIAAKFSNKTGEPAILDEVQRWFASPLSCLLNDSQPLGVFDGKDIHGDYGYPSIKNIERVLRRVGIGDPGGKLNGTAKRDVMSLLESVGDLRIALAHSASLPGISCCDVIDKLSDLKAFVAAMDRTLYFHVRSSLPDSAWKANVC